MSRGVHRTLHQQIYHTHRYTRRDSRNEGATGSEEAHSPCSAKEDFSSRDALMQGLDGEEKENDVKCWDRAQCHGGKFMRIIFHRRVIRLSGTASES
jgi:hypothetical protein